ncbi:citrate lyase subunit alpha [Pseudoflavonifractor phocaeensis]|uniref:citrate lyase subunit alpha n=1 Tax=Pseudoflavonifractor phocaeensis TaxID=1870988 RepID=UPI0025A45229|nr:citrate lyase subunit alpha [Pseudoflavonifractor phocaeensis]MDM8238424.1 citrate lyase subunit alpha [Pseudoflavonifractor phocaeensis]
MVNSLGRELPEFIGGYRVRPYQGLETAESTAVPVQSKRIVERCQAGQSKLLGSLKEALLACGLKDGMTISFHHSFREGDLVVGQVMEAIGELGIKNLRFAPSAVVNLKNFSLAKYVEDGTIIRVEASGIRGELGDHLIDGSVQMDEPAILRPHGARPRAIETGELEIDVAFIAVSASDVYGNCTGQIGTNRCGSLGYSFVDAHNANKVVVITDTLVDYPCCPASISQQYVDYVVKVDQVGDSAKIGAGAARLTKNPRDLMIAQKVVKVIAASRRFVDGFSFQTGAGAISIACTKFLAEEMEKKQVKASFALGGITAAIIDMYDAGLVRVVECSQSFDATAASAILSRPGVLEIDNADYSNAFNKGNFLNHLNFGVLGALEVDTDFNVNLLTSSSGKMMGGLGGGPDVAAGADISIVTLPIVRGRTPSVVDRVFTCCTPGETVACVVTQAGIALNPRHRNYAELREDLERAGIKPVDIQELRRLAEELTGRPEPIKTTQRIVAVVEYRDGTVVDVVREVVF